MALNITEMVQQALCEVAIEGDQVSYDLSIVSYGGDLRSLYVLTQLRRSMKQVFAVLQQDSENDLDAVMAFEKRYSASVVSIDILKNNIDDFLQKYEGISEPNIFVDVSSMPRLMLAKVLSYIKVVCFLRPLKLALGYSLARYISPPEQPFPSIRRLAPVHREFSGWAASPALPVDVIVGLGYEKGKAIGAVEYLEPRNRWVFIPSSPEHRFLQKVTSHNRELITAGDGVIDYEVLQPVDTYFRLMSLVVGLSPTARPILLPFGPKLFFALALLVSMRFEKAAVWHVDSDDDLFGGSSSPSGHGIVLSCRISDESQM